MSYGLIHLLVLYRGGLESILPPGAVSEDCYDKHQVHQGQELLEVAVKNNADFPHKLIIVNGKDMPSNLRY